MMKIDMTAFGISMSTFKAFYQDIESNMAGGNKNIFKEIRTLEKDANDMPAAMKIVMKIPLMTERENVIRTVFQEKEDGKYLWLVHSTERDDCPRSDNRIRIDMFEGTIFWPVENGVRMVQLRQLNMKGYFPMRLMNMAMSGT